MHLGKRGSGKQRDSSSFTLVKFNTKTNFRSIMGQQVIKGAEKAELTHRERLKNLTQQEVDAGWTWLLEANSHVARTRLAYGFKPGRN